MNGELWKLKDDTHKTASSKAWLWSFAGVVGGLLMGAVGYRFLVLKKPTAETPPIPAPAPAAVYEPGRQQGLKLFEGKTTFAMHLMQMVDLRLPCSGLLTIDLKFQKERASASFC
jgi:hypothetical protein